MSIYSLELSQDLFSFAFLEAPARIALLTPAGEIAAVNNAYADLLGYTREELASQDFRRFVHPGDAPVLLDFLRSSGENSSRRQSFEIRLIRKDGAILHTRTTARSQIPAEGGPAVIIAVCEPAEARQHALASYLPQMVWTAGPDASLVYVNEPAAACFGAAADRLLGTAWHEWIHPEDRIHAVERWKQSEKSAAPWEVAVRLQCDSWRWFLLHARLFDGEWLGSCTDIDEQKRAEESLRRQSHTFDTALSHIPDFVYIFDSAGRFTYVNSPLLRLWQKSFDEVCGKNFFDLGYPPELAGRLQTQIQEVIDTRRLLRDQTPFSGPDGESRDYEYIFVPVLDTMGEVKAVAGSTRDITAQYRSAQRIDEDRARWRNLLHLAPAAIGVLRGPDHIFEWVNAEYARMVGRPAHSLIGRTVIEVLPELEGQVFVGLLDDVFRTGNSFVGHEELFRVVRGEGELEDAYVNFVYAATRNPAGAIEGIFVHATDVSDFVNARKSVEASEERFRGAIQANSSLIWTNNAAGEMEGEQPGWGGFTGQRPEEYRGYGWATAVHPDDAKPTVDAWMRAVAERRMFVFEHRVRRYDGVWRLFSIRALPLFNADGEIREWVGVHNDITEERSLLNALRQSEARFRQAIDSMPQLVWSTDREGVPDLYNKQWLEYTGLPAGDGQAGEWNPVHPEDEAPVRESWRHSLQTGDSFEQEFRYRRNDGMYRWFLARATAIRDDAGAVIRWFCTATDIEDRRKAEAAVLTKQKLESLGLLAGGIAHDFNNLLVGVLGGASYAQDSLPKSHPLQPTLEGIVSAGERAAHLTRQMLAYAGKGRFLIEAVDMGDLVRNTCRLIRSSIPDHVQVAMEIGEDLPTVEADAGQMQQIAMNLILNAAEAIQADAPGFVALRVEGAVLDAAAISRIELAAGSLVPGGWVVFEVQDNGSGMDPGTQLKIFDPFFTTKFTGRGLGLSAVQGILRAHKAALELRSRPGEGSTFRVFLPASTKKIVSVPSPPPTARGRGGTVLIVDDEEIVVRTARAILQRAGFDVKLAASGPQAIGQLSESGLSVQVIVLDMSMPGMSGKDVLEKIRLMGIAAPVLICSGYSEAEVYRQFSGLDIAGVIPKPFEARQLVSRIQDALDGLKTGA